MLLAATSGGKAGGSLRARPETWGFLVCVGGLYGEGFVAVISFALPRARLVNHELLIKSQVIVKVIHGFVLQNLWFAFLEYPSCLTGKHRVLAEHTRSQCLFFPFAPHVSSPFEKGRALKCGNSICFASFLEGALK